MSEPTPLTEIAGRLSAARNPDGGWSYYAGKSSRLEPTSWTLLALGDGGSVDVLQAWPQDDSGLLLERHGGAPNFGFHALGLLALLVRDPGDRRRPARLIDAIQRVRGIRLEDRGVNRQNNALQAWSWMSETFSWVEPTACCLVALKKARAAGFTVDARRIEDGEAVLFDRCGREGGWNYGNANMLGQELPAYVPTTALGLLALGDHRSHDAVRRSLDFLEREALTERSSVALSLALVALRVFDRPADHVRTALVEQLPTTFSLGNHHPLAMALYALRENRYAAFRV